MSAFYPYTYKTPQYGEKDYQQALKKYEQLTGSYSDLLKTSSQNVESAMTDVRSGLSEAKSLRDYYQPGGGYGEGQRMEAKETVGQGVAQTMGQMVGSGMSSLFATRGINVLANTELSKLYKNIEDTRNQLLIQAFTPYAQMIQTLGELAGVSGNLAGTVAQIASAAPTRNQYITQGQPEITGMKGYPTKYSTRPSAAA